MHGHDKKQKNCKEDHFEEAQKDRCMNKNTRIFFFRLVVVGLLLITAMVLYYIGKSHDLILENKAITSGSVSYEEAPSIRVFIDNLDPILVMSGFANKAVIVGSKHTLRAE